MTHNKYSFVREVIFAATLAASVAGTANADDSSISQFGSDSYRYFASQPIEKASSAWRMVNPGDESADNCVCRSCTERGDTLVQ